MWVSSKNYLYDASGKSQPYNPKKVPVPVDYYECNYEEEQRKKENPVYWKQVKYPWSADKEELTTAAESGNPEARLQLYWHHTSDGLYWLCHAANQGYPKARYRVAQLYEFGDDGIGRDFKRAYIWYDLAAKACHPWARKDALRVSQRFLTDDQRNDVSHMIEQWSPLDCKSWSDLESFY
jgi:TPR repeat protein